jgi:hypothetical protein
MNAIGGGKTKKAPSAATPERREACVVESLSTQHKKKDIYIFLIPPKTEKK